MSSAPQQIVRHWPQWCVVAAAAALGSVLPAVAQTASTPAAPADQVVAPRSLDPQLGSVVISATRSEKDALDVPASVDVVDAQAIAAGGLRVNLSESLARVPGIVTLNRQNYAQDLQISSRGFGARSTFGIRGLRLYVDGIPATMPDGQGQLSHIDLASAERIEVLRGPFSSLYGNSSGGVINVFTEEGAPGNVADVGLVLGSDNTRRLGLKLSGATGQLNYVLSASRFETDGYRDHSEAARNNFNGKLKYTPNSDTEWTFVLNSVRMPSTQDPLGLSRAEWEKNPRQATPNAELFNVRKSVSQDQLGATLRQRLTADDTLHVMVYAGQRATTQYQAIPIATQKPITHSGGMIDLDRNYFGTDVRWTHQGQLLGTPASVTVGMSFDKMREKRLGFENFIGTQLGVKGALRRDENNQVSNFDQYVQGDWQINERWSALAGLRHSRVAFDSVDHYLSNGADGGRKNYSATTPVLGLVFRANENLSLYSSYGKGFETPTFNELAYLPSGSSGLNFGLQPARSRQWELGAKSRFAQGWSGNLAYFEARTSDEITVLQNSGGRTVYQNAGRTQRRGWEASLGGPLGHGFKFYGAATLMRASYRDGFLTCNSTPCAAANVAVVAGNRIPGIPGKNLYAELQWGALDRGFETAVELRHSGKVYVNDLNNDATSAYTTAALRLTWQQKRGNWKLREFVRIDNLADKKYVGSVIVNDGNNRFFESAPGRTWLVGMNALYAF